MPLGETRCRVAAAMTSRVTPMTAPATISQLAGDGEGGVAELPGGSLGVALSEIGVAAVCPSRG
jgi:hypothetical protein